MQKQQNFIEKMPRLVLDYLLIENLKEVIKD